VSVHNTGATNAPQVRADYCPTCDQLTDIPNIPCRDCVALEVTTGLLWHTCPRCLSWALARPGRWCKAPDCRGADLRGWRP
jgi:hypothetical protein